MLYDVFISHASEDKEKFVRPLAKRLKNAHLEVWYDEFSLQIGDSLRKSIDMGLAKSRYGVVILSPAFFKKRWPEKELNGLVAREVQVKDKIILPVWHNITAEEIIKFSPLLADVQAAKSSLGLSKVTKELLKVIRPEASPLIIARDELIKRGLNPPVISDEWWLDIAEQSNAYWFQDKGWNFPLPGTGEKGTKRGQCLAWTACQWDWEIAAEDLNISQITKPEKVLGFINSYPGLKEICHLHPDYLASYAPQLTIKGFGGEFENDFDLMLGNSIKNHCKSSGGEGLTKTGKAPLCDEWIALRHSNFGDYEPVTIACNFVQGEMGHLPVRCYDHFEYLIWFLTDDSKWLPRKIHDFLLKGMKDWGYATMSCSKYWEQGKKFFHYLTDLKDVEATFTPEVKGSLKEIISLALKELDLNDDSERVMAKFMKEDVIGAYIETMREHERLRKENA